MNNPKSEINILLLGETGVGKSTFINAFANYLNFSEFEDAEKGEAFCLIPTSFVLTNSLNNRVTVKFGMDDNESENVLKGESATQSCRDYVFHVGDSVIRFIDTPGIGDTRGIERDKSNLENILSAIGDHQYLNAICILLRPTNPRLTAAFEFVITMLLTQLDKSAANNIIFVYTNARSSNFTPGDTAIPIGELLSKIHNTMGISIIHDVRKNVFCLDNETFRFMLASKDNIQFGKRERRGFEDSWQVSVEECERLLKYVSGGSDGSGLKPHNTKSTTSIFEARRMIEALKIPLEEIANEIQLNIGVLMSKESELRQYNGEIKELHEKYSIPIFETKTSELAEPGFVCASENCREHYELSSGATYTHYPQKCIKYTKFNDTFTNYLRIPLSKTPLIYIIPVFNRDGSCKKCNCYYNEHIYEIYATEIIERRDESLKTKLDNMNDLTEIKKAYCEQYEKNIIELNGEQEVIFENSAKFAHFLKNNAIIAYNDSFEKYINFSIENEETKESNTFRDEQIKRYKKMLDEYRDMKSRYEILISSDPIVENITPTNVYRLIEQLYQLPRFGQRIEARCSMEANAGSNARKRMEVVHGINDGNNKVFRDKQNSRFRDLFSY